jgi:hypothetical protein
VTGSATQEPSWNQLFADRCDNHWTYREDWTDTIAAGKRVTNYASYYNRTGTNSFTHANPTDTASRDLDEQVCDDLWYEITNTVGAGGSGGGS